MICKNDMAIFDADIYAKKLCIFYKNREKISTYFGLILTIIYISISLAIFLFYTVQTIKRLDLQVNDSTIYWKEKPFIDLNNSDLLYFAFGVENGTSASRFIDDSIYTIRAIFYDYIKNENGTFVKKEEKDLKVEKCQKEKFGENYQYLFKEGEFNNSYCISNLDFILTGGFIYDRLSLIKLELFPCINSSDNNNHCKSQEKIDELLGGGYFSFLLKDIGLSPQNYTSPVMPTIKDIYTTISKQFFRDLIIYYEITEIKTDRGFFGKNIHKERHLRFDRKVESFFLRSEDKYYKGESIMSVQIRLSDNIHVQNREYKKMQSVFATTGGYMQMINTIFTLLVILPNKYFYDNIIVDNLFTFDLKKNKIHIKHNSMKHINRKKCLKEIKKPKRESQPEYTNFKQLKNKEEDLNNESRSENRIRNYLSRNVGPADRSINMSAYEKINNITKLDVIDLKFLNSNKHTFIHKIKKYEKSVTETSFNNYSTIYLNFLDYLFFARCKEKDNKFKLFKKATSIFKQKLDIITIFNCILYAEKSNEEKYNQ